MNPFKVPDRYGIYVLAVVACVAVAYLVVREKDNPWRADRVFVWNKTGPDGRARSIQLDLDHGGGLSVLRTATDAAGDRGSAWKASGSWILVARDVTLRIRTVYEPWDWSGKTMVFPDERTTIDPPRTFVLRERGSEFELSDSWISGEAGPILLCELHLGGPSSVIGTSDSADVPEGEGR